MKFLNYKPMLKNFKGYMRVGKSFFSIISRTAFLKFEIYCTERRILRNLRKHLIYLNKVIFILIENFS